MKKNYLASLYIYSSNNATMMPETAQMAIWALYIWKIIIV